jgi:cysteine desulfurase
MDVLYLDNHATTPIDPRVRDAMWPLLGEAFGNPASRTHALGLAARRAVEAARREAAEAICATPDELVFTSGATESLNLAIRGHARARAADKPGAAVFCFAADHSATRACTEATSEAGMRPQVLPVDVDGLPDLDALDAAIAAADAGVLAIVCTAVHNELGSIAPVAALAARAHAVGAVCIVDAAQAPGRVPIDVDAWDADLVAWTAHKCYGPKGAGALYVRRQRRSVAVAPLQVGGGQEGGLRPGTLATAQIVGFSRALSLAEAEREADQSRIAGLRDAFLAELAETPAFAWNGGRDTRVVGNLNLRFEAIDAATLLLALPDVAISAGSACASGNNAPSVALTALGLSREEALSSLRIGLGRFNTLEQVRRAGSRIATEIAAQRASSPLWAMRDDVAALRALGFGR